MRKVHYRIRVGNEVAATIYHLVNLSDDVCSNCTANRTASVFELPRVLRGIMLSKISKLAESKS